MEAVLLNPRARLRAEIADVRACGRGTDADREMIGARKRPQISGLLGIVLMTSRRRRAVNEVSGRHR